MEAVDAILKMKRKLFKVHDNPLFQHSAARV